MALNHVIFDNRETLRSNLLSISWGISEEISTSWGISEEISNSHILKSRYSLLFLIFFGPQDFKTNIT